MELNVRVNEKDMIKQLNHMIDTVIEDEMSRRYSNTSRMVSDAVKEIIYSRKEEIINKVVERATAEIVRKGMPKFIGEMAKELEEKRG